MEKEEIRILARPQMDPSRCDFEVDRKITDRVAFFPGKDAAEGSPLAEAIFALPGVQQILFRGNVVTVTKDESVPWPELARQIGAAIRSRIQEGGPLLAENVGGGAEGDDDMRRRVEEVVTQELNPALAAHGGFVEIVDVKGGIVHIKMGGGCQGCASSAATLRMGIEQAIRQKVPEVLEIVDVTDHEAGTNPYYSEF